MDRSLAMDAAGRPILVQRAEAELRASGVAIKSVRGTPDSLAGLTPQQRQIASDDA